MIHHWFLWYGTIQIKEINKDNRNSQKEKGQKENVQIIQEDHKEPIWCIFELNVHKILPFFKKPATSTSVYKR